MMSHVHMLLHDSVRGGVELSRQKIILSLHPKVQCFGSVSFTALQTGVCDYFLDFGR